MEGTLTNLLDDPVVGAVVCNYRDITERKQAEEERSPTTSPMPSSTPRSISQ